jgi:hypothetical protein
LIYKVRCANYEAPQVPKQIENLLVVLSVCETCSVTVREEYTLRVFGNKMLRGIFRRKRREAG